MVTLCKMLKPKCIGSYENAMALADGIASYIPIGTFQGTVVLKDDSKITEAFQTGRGLSWGEHNPNLFIRNGKVFQTRL